MKTLILGGFTKKLDFQGRSSRKPNIEGGLPRRGSLEQFAGLRGEGGGAWEERGGWCF